MRVRSDSLRVRPGRPDPSTSSSSASSSSSSSTGATADFFARLVLPGPVPTRLRLLRELDATAEPGSYDADASDSLEEPGGERPDELPSVERSSESSETSASVVSDLAVSEGERDDSVEERVE